MAFQITNLTPIGGQTGRGNSPQVYAYTTTDDLSTVQTAGYFNQIFTKLKENDLIFANIDTDGTPTKGILYVTQEATSSTTNVETTDWKPLDVTDSEDIEDTVGAMFTSNTETLITATYQDVDGTIDLVVDNDLSNYSNTTSAFITASSTDTLTNKTFGNTDLHLLDTNASHDLIVAPGSDLTADRTFTLTTGDADRTLTVSADVTLDQDVDTTASPSFAGLSVAADTNINVALGVAKIGFISGFSDGAAFSHFDKGSTTEYALLQATDGQTFMNTVTGTEMRFAIGGVTKNKMDTSGNYTCEADGARNIGSPTIAWAACFAKKTAGLSITDTITAFAGGGQGSATLLGSSFNRITVVATAGDSVKLPASPKTGELITIRNDDSAEACDVFPNTGDQIEALGANTAFSLTAGSVVQLIATSTSQWYRTSAS